MVEVIMPDNTTANAVDVMPELIRSAVQNALENSEGFDLRSKAGIEELAWMIVDHHSIVTQGEINMDFHVVLDELQSQLRN